MFFKKRSKNTVDSFISKGAGILPIGDQLFLKVSSMDVDGFGGTILHAELIVDYGSHTISLQRFKFIVEPLTKWEKLLGLDKRGKTDKALKKLKSAALNFVNTGESCNQFGIPGMFMAVVK